MNYLNGYAIKNCRVVNNLTDIHGAKIKFYSGNYEDLLDLQLVDDKIITLGFPQFSYDKKKKIEEMEEIFLKAIEKEIVRLKEKNLFPKTENVLFDMETLTFIMDLTNMKPMVFFSIFPPDRNIICLGFDERTKILYKFWPSDNFKNIVAISNIMEMSLMGKNPTDYGRGLAARFISRIFRRPFNYKIDLLPHFFKPGKVSPRVTEEMIDELVKVLYSGREEGGWRNVIS